MKKIHVTIVLAITLVFGLNSQTRVGIKAGVNFAKLTGDVRNAKSRTSFVFGPMVDIKITEKFSFQLELLYSSQGTKAQAKDFDGTYNEEQKLDYLYVLYVAKYYMAENLSLEVGPQRGLLLSAKDEYDYPGDSGKLDIYNLIKKNDFGVNFGLGYTLNNGFNFGARYYLGLKNIAEEPYASKLTNRVFQITIGYFFN